MDVTVSTSTTIWNQELTEEEVRLLNLGYSPILVAPEKIQEYRPNVKIR